MTRRLPFAARIEDGPGADHRDRPGPATADAVAPEALVEVRAVSRTFRTKAGAVAALDDVSLEIAPAAFFTLLGPSGCGKTTLLRMIAGFEHPDAGGILLDGRSMLQDAPNKRPVNIVFQSYALFPHLSVAQNVAFGLERLGRRGPAVAARVAAVLDLVRLGDLAQRRPHQLSGGQQQRVALARALAPEPRLLLLDEPLSALDLGLRHGMQVELKRIQRETGIAFLLVTHDQEEALSLSDTIAVMDAGRILQVGRPEAIFERPASRFVAAFMGATVLPGALVGLAAPHAAIRPDRIVVGPEADLPATPQAAVSLGGRLESMTYRGARTACVVALDAGLSIVAERISAGDSLADRSLADRSLADRSLADRNLEDRPGALEPGRRVSCRFPRAALVPLEA